MKEASPGPKNGQDVQLAKLGQKQRVLNPTEAPFTLEERSLKEPPHGFSIFTFSRALLAPGIKVFISSVRGTSKAGRKLIPPNF
jgi:hypothetical protein